jgi:L,D-peptidoglycan transpeptidase YkuD (ErfK/YbiS/YcfS/YnhG family)
VARPLVVVLLVLAGCERRPPDGVAPRSAAGEDATSATSATSTTTRGEDGERAAEFAIPDTTAELVVGVVDDWDATRVTLARYRRRGASWDRVAGPWPGVVGHAGIAWGDGLHGRGAPAGRQGPSKREGDGRAPAGAFALRGLYGDAKAPPRNTRLPYTRVTDSWRCVDDPASRHYARIVDERAVGGDWSSAERMRQPLYRWVIDIAHNDARRPDGGSCIFFHAWGAGEPTAGCTAMAEDTLRGLVVDLDPSAVYVLLPRAEYDALAPMWRLP